MQVKSFMKVGTSLDIAKLPITSAPPIKKVERQTQITKRKIDYFRQVYVLRLAIASNGEAKHLKRPIVLFLSQTKVKTLES